MQKNSPPPARMNFQPASQPPAVTAAAIVIVVAATGLATGSPPPSCGPDASETWGQLGSRSAQASTLLTAK